MVDRVHSKRRRVMRSFQINELSCVDNPAQKHALAVLMKRDDSADDDFDKAGEGNPNHDPKTGEFASGPGGNGGDGKGIDQKEFSRITLLFDRNKGASELAGQGVVDLQNKYKINRETAQAVYDHIEMKTHGLGGRDRSQLSTLNKDDDEGDTPMTDAEKKQLDELQKSVIALTSKLEAATVKDPAKKAADLQAELDVAKAEVEKLSAKVDSAKDLVGKAKEEYDEAVAKGSMSDAEKGYMAGLDCAAKMKFMQATPDERKKMMHKAADADPVVYKSESSGEEFRKSDDPRLVKLAKQADESEKIAKEERQKRETSELSKRVDDELKYISEDVAKRDDKIEVLRSIEKMEDGPKAALLKMLSVGGKAISAAFDKIGHTNEGAAKSSLDFNKRVAEIMARDKTTKLDALDKAAREFPQEFDAYQATGVQLSN